MREYVSRQKKTTTGFSIPSLKQPTRGFGFESSAISRQAVPKIQPLNKPLTHDISRIPLRSQAKLSISQPGDLYEQEADSVAQQVMQRMAQPVNRQSIQREALPEEEELQMKPLANSITPLVQREEVPEEEEELQMKSLDNRTLQREALPEEEEELQMKSLDNRTLQREALPEEEEELQMKSMVQRQGEAGMAAAPDLEASINQARGGGQAIADNIRQPMEQAFGADFSSVKVHTDGQSDQLNQSIQARAFTTGQDVFFRSGEYNPGSRGGQELLAHELTHVVQQNGGAVQRRSLFNFPQKLSVSARNGRMGLVQRMYQVRNVQRYQVQRELQAPTIRIHRLGTNQIQRGIKKTTAKGGGTYTVAPLSFENERLTHSVRMILKDIIDNDKKNKGGNNYTLKQAITYAKRKVENSGRFITGRLGTRIQDTNEMSAFLATQGADTTVVDTKFTNHPQVWDGIFKQVEIVETDFQAMRTTGNGQTVWSNFTSKITEVVPQLTRTISAFNEVTDEMVNNHQQTGSALKGSMFETWSLDNVLLTANQRAHFQQRGKMAQDRLSDGYDPKTKILWDMKHYYTKMSQSTNNDQARDYKFIMDNQYKSKTGNIVSTVNYLFPDLNGAKANDWLATTYGFGVYYVQSPNKLIHYA